MPVNRNLRQPGATGGKVADSVVVGAVFSLVTLALGDDGLVGVLILFWQPIKIMANKSKLQNL